MQTLQEYIHSNVSEIDEGLFSSSIAYLAIKRMDSDRLLNSLIHMYEFICDNPGVLNKKDEDEGSSIDMFYRNFPVKERPLWMYIFRLYKKQLISIFDMSDDSALEELDIEEGSLVKLDIEARRNIRHVIQSSSSRQNINPTLIDQVLVIDDPQFDKKYMFTINKLKGAARVFRVTDIKFLEGLYDKLS